MKTDTEIMNELAISSGILSELTESESKRQKDLLKNMYKDIARVCDAHSIVYMLGGGSCLGAIRHKGYIPWDDDLDIMMPRESYERFLSLLANNALGDKYEFDAPNIIADCRNTYLKIYRTESLDVEITSESAPGPKGIFIDIFPMDFAPKGLFRRKLKGVVSDFLQAVCSCVLYVQYPTKLYKEFMMRSSEGRIRYFQRMVLGHIFGIFPHKKWVWWFDKWNKCEKDTGFLTIPTGRKHYLGECRPTNTYLPVRTAEFEGMDVYVPNDVDAYLTSMYKNYMQLPPVEKRERHFVYKFKLPEE